MLSMTGFASKSIPYDNGSFTLEIKTVNHRFLDIRTRVPPGFLSLEPLMEKMIRKKINRGYCTCNLEYTGKSEPGCELNTKAVEKHLASLIKVASKMELCLADLVPVLSNAPQMFTESQKKAGKEIPALVKKLSEQCLGELLDVRQIEGQSMLAELKSTLKRISKMADKIKNLSSRDPKLAFKKLSARLKKLSNDSSFHLDEGKLEMEAAILADKIDITEEMVRLSSHFKNARKTLQVNIPCGRKLEFILQEMLRETNTIGSKTPSGEVSSTVVEIKIELEKMREIVLNIE